MRHLLQKVFKPNTKDQGNEGLVELQETYRSVFSSPDGKIVLSHMLRELGFFSPQNNEDDLVLQNFAKKVLQLCGIYDRVNVYDLDLIEAFFKIPLKDTEGNYLKK